MSPQQTSNVIPLEQGLRQFILFIMPARINASNVIPLEQGLRQSNIVTVSDGSLSSNVIPLEQGLRQQYMKDDKNDL